MDDFKDILDELNEVTNEKPQPIVFATFVLDHSGSMNGDQKMCISNFNEQIQSMKANKDVLTYFTKVDFSNNVILTGPYPIEHVKEITVYETSGLTALNDAIARAIEVNKKMMSECKSEDKSSLVVIMTDGQENASVDFEGQDGAERLQKTIKELQDQGDWTFTFMGAGLDIQKYAVQNLGMSFGNTMCFEKSKNGYEELNNSTIRGLDSYYEMRVRGGKSTGDFIGNPVNDGSTTASNKWVDDGSSVEDPVWDAAVDEFKNSDKAVYEMTEEELNRHMKNLMLKLEDKDGDEEKWADD